MRLFAVALALSVVLSAAPSSVYAQQAPAPAAPAAQQPAPQAPATTPPAQADFQEGLKYAYVDVQAVAAESAEGKAAA